jgi:hypothetical protein
MGNSDISLTCNRKSKLDHANRQIIKSSNYIILMRIFNFLQVPRLYMACLMVKSGRTVNLLGVVTQYEILEFCRLGLNPSRFY